MTESAFSDESMFLAHGWEARYHTRGLIIEFPKDVFDGNLRIVPGAFPTLLHEYTHWLQDIGTISGWVEILHSLQYHQKLHEHVKEVNVVELPVRSTFISEREALHKAADPRPDFWSGEKELHFSRTEVREEKLLISGQTVAAHMAKVYYRHKRLNREVWRFVGTREVKEAYASAITELSGGRTLDDRRSSGQNVEYWVLYDVAQAALGAWLSAHHLVGICHHALNFAYPGVGFLSLLGNLREELGDTEASPEEVLALCRGAAWNDSVLHGGRAQFDELIAVLADWKSQYPGTLPTMSFEWLCSLISQLWYLNWAEDKHFPLDQPFCRARLSQPEAINALMTEQWLSVPMPLVLQPSQMVSTLQDQTSSDICYFLASLNLVTRFLLNPEGLPRIACPFFGCCAVTGPQKNAEDCLKAPWTRGGFDQKCTYGLAAFYVGIHDKVFMKRAANSP